MKRRLILKIIDNMHKWYLRNFEIITIHQAKRFNLEFVQNVHGDMIIRLACRSIWQDSSKRAYRVDSLHYPERKTKSINKQRVSYDDALLMLEKLRKAPSSSDTPNHTYVHDDILEIGHSYYSEEAVLKIIRKLTRNNLK